MVNVLKAMNLMGGILTLETKHNARMKTLEKLRILLLLLFFGYTGAYSASFRSLWQVLGQIQHDVPPTPRKETCREHAGLGFLGSTSYRIQKYSQ